MTVGKLVFCSVMFCKYLVPAYSFLPIFSIAIFRTLENRKPIACRHFSFWPAIKINLILKVLGIRYETSSFTVGKEELEGSRDQSDVFVFSALDHFL